MVQLNRSMMERYEIPNRIPTGEVCALFGADRLMLGCAAGLIDRLNENGANIGCLCVTPAAETLNAQNGMFTLLVRGESIDGKRIQEERVVQSIVRALHPEKDLDQLRLAAGCEALNAYVCHQNASDEEIAVLALMLYERFCANCSAPQIFLLAELPVEGCAERLKAAIGLVARQWSDDFAQWFDEIPFTRVLCESLNGPLSETEKAAAWKKMNYRDELIAWAEPYMGFAADENAPEALKKHFTGEKYAVACEKKKRIFDTAAFICAAIGYISGMDSFAQVMKDENMRALIAHAFFDEIMPVLPWTKDEIAPYVISCFERLENPMNEMPLLEIAHDMLKNFPETLGKSIDAYANENFEAPRYLSFAFAAAIMLYAGARRDADGKYRVARENGSAVLYDDEEILEAFSRFSHDMPSQTLAYAALADRSCWDRDLREIDGLEMRISNDLSAIQRIGVRESIRLALRSCE